MDIEQLRHELNTPVTIVHLRIQVLQRRLARREGLTEESRLWLEDELATLLVAVKSLGEVIAAMPGSSDPDQFVATISGGREVRRNMPDHPETVSRK